MARCVLHVGTHKTGTTTIQNAIAERREELKEKKIYYPALDKKGKSHNKLAHRLATCKNGDLIELRKILNGCVDSIKNQNDCLLLSAEEFSTRICFPDPYEKFDSSYFDNRYIYLEKLWEIVSDFEKVDTYICFRNHEEYAHSLYATKLLRGQIKGSFQDFVKQCVPIFDYHSQLSVFEAFGPVHVKRFEDMKDDLVASFFSWLDIPLRPVKTARLKQTPPLELIFWLAQGVQAGINDRERKLRAQFCRNFPVENLDVPVPAESLWESEEERDRFFHACTFVDGKKPMMKGRTVNYAALQINQKKIDAMFFKWRIKSKFQFWPFRLFS